MKQKPTPATRPGRDFLTGSLAQQALEPKAPGCWSNWDHYSDEPEPELGRPSGAIHPKLLPHSERSDVQASSVQPPVYRCGTSNFRRRLTQTESRKGQSPESPPATNLDARTRARFEAAGRSSRFERVRSYGFQPSRTSSLESTFLLPEFASVIRAEFQEQSNPVLRINLSQRKRVAKTQQGSIVC